MLQKTHFVRSPSALPLSAASPTAPLQSCEDIELRWKEREGGGERKRGGGKRAAEKERERSESDTCRLYSDSLVLVLRFLLQHML